MKKNLSQIAMQLIRKTRVSSAMIASSTNLDTTFSMLSVRKLFGSTTKQTIHKKKSKNTQTQNPHFSVLLYEKHIKLDRFYYFCSPTKRLRYKESQILKKRRGTQMSTEITPVVIDIKKAIAMKNPRLANSIPGFIIRFMERTIHQDEMNVILKKYANVFGTKFVRALLNEFNITYTTHNIENIPKDGRYIFVSNHPLGGFDGVILADILASNWSEPRILVNDLLLIIKNYNPLFLPINKHGANARDAIKKIDEAHKADYPILDFPFGLVSRKVNGVVQDFEWKRTFVSKAKKHKRDIVPIYFDGINSKRFYRVAKWRKRLRIKANIEMFYLPSEAFKKRNCHFNVYFGKPISYKTLTSDKKNDEWAAEIKKTAYSLKPDN